jgi:hypothetical protein
MSKHTETAGTHYDRKKHFHAELLKGETANNPGKRRAANASSFKGSYCDIRAN